MTTLSSKLREIKARGNRWSLCEKLFTESEVSLDMAHELTYLLREVPIRRYMPNDFSHLTAPWMRLVTHLYIHDCCVLERDIIDMVQSPHSRSLVEIDMSSTLVGDDTLRALANSPYLMSLRTLHVDSTLCTDEGVIALAKAPLTLKRLCLEDLIEVTCVGAKAIARSPHMRELEHLNLSSTEVLESGVKALVTSPNMTNLKYLALEGNGYTDEVVDILTESPELSNLRVLNLSYNEITTSGLVTLLDSPYLTNLRFVDLSSNFIGVEGESLIRAALHFSGEVRF